MAGPRHGPSVGQNGKGTPVTAAAIPDQRALRDPAGACIADERQDLHNVGFAERVTAVAAVFAAAGLGRGGVLAVLLPNRVELVTSMFAAWRLGAAVTPVNPALTAQEARYQIRRLGRHPGRGRRRGRGDAGWRPVPDQRARRGDHPVPPPTSPSRFTAPPALVTNPGALAPRIYTSGTTGRPKGVMLDHASISATAEIVIGWLEMTADIRCLLVLPLFHVNGIMVSVVSPLLAGGSTFIAERFHTASFWATVEQVRPTYFSAVPTIHALLASRPGAQPDARSLRFVICGAAPMPRQLIGEFEQRFGVPVVEGYGLSECTVVCTANPLHGVRKAGSVGLPLPGIDVGVVDQADQLLPAGQSGEVVVRGPNVMRGYLGRPDETAHVLRGGWLHTGDVGRRHRLCRHDHGQWTEKEAASSRCLINLARTGNGNLYAGQPVSVGRSAVSRAAQSMRADSISNERTGHEVQKCNRAPTIRLILPVRRRPRW